MRFLLLLGVGILILILGSCVNEWRVERKHPPSGSYIDVDGVRLHYLDRVPPNPIVAIKKPAVVLFHGASGNLLDMNMALGDELAKNHRVIVFDRPGRGYSARPEDGYSLAVQARLMHSALEKLGVEKPIIAAQSLGGAVALAYALEFQEDLSGLVLMAPVSHEWPGGIIWYNRIAAKPLIGALFRRTIVPIYAYFEAPKGIDGNFWPQAAPEDYYNATGLDLLFRSKDFQSNAADISHLKTNIINMMQRYDEIDLPTIIYVGTHDTTVSPTIHSYALSKQIPHSQLTILPKTGHGLHHTASAEISASIKHLADIVAKGDKGTDFTTDAIMAKIRGETMEEGDVSSSAAQDIESSGPNSIDE